MVTAFGAIIVVSLLRLIFWPLKEGDRWFTWSACLVFWVLLTFRNYSFGPDLEFYVFSYDLAATAGWKELLGGSIDLLSRDPVFYGTAKLVSLTGVGPRGWLGVLSAVYCIAVAKSIRRYSSAPYLSWIMFVTLGFMAFGMTALRQTVASSILLLLIPSLVGRRWIRFVIGVAVASLFHWSALIYLFAYPLANRKIGRLQVGIVVASVGLGLVGAELFRNALRYLSSFVDSLGSYADSETALTWSGLVIYLSIFIFSVVCVRQLARSGWSPDSAKTVFLNLVAISLIFFSLSVVVAESFRIALYFAVVAILLVPSLIVKLRPGVKNAMYAVILLLNLAYFAYSSPLSGFELSW